MPLNTKPPLISIALCTYNGERFLEAQIESVLNQSWRNIELVIVDDASTDSTVAIAESYALKDERIRIHRNAHNLGINQNFSLALSLCQGQLLAPCDQDDIWHPEKLSRLHDRIGTHLMAYCDSELITESGQPMGMKISDRLQMFEGHGPLALTFWNCISGHAMLFRRELLDHALPIPPLKFHDWWLAFWAAAVGGVVYLNEPLVQYRQHAGGQTDLSRSGHQTESAPRSNLFIERCRWFSQLAQVPHADQPYIQKLSDLYAAQSHQWFSFSLIRHLRQRSEEILLINKRSSFLRFALKHFWGLKAKSFFSPHQYKID
jgi:glycosyltransferase involved in cell wall biosynthesis